MVKCCVLWCGNDYLKQQDVTFYKLPPGAYKKSSYDCINASSKDELFACSEHYNVNDFVKDREGKMRLKIEAIPIIKLCRICLQTNVKLIDMNQYNLKIYFQDIIGVNVELNNDLYLNNMLCVECAYRLRNFYKFKEKSIWANTILMNLPEKNKQMSRDMLNSLSQERSKLKSNLTYKHYEPDYFDMKVDETVLYETKNDDEIDFKDIINNKINIMNEIDQSMDNSISSDIDNVEYLSEFSSDDDLTLQEIEEKIEKIESKLAVKKKEAKENSPKFNRRSKLLERNSMKDALLNVNSMNLEQLKGELLKGTERLHFKCTYCCKGFLDDKSYSMHILTHNDMSQAMLNSLSQERSQLKSNLTYKVDKTEQFGEIKYEDKNDLNQNNEIHFNNESDQEMDNSISNDIDNVANLSDYSSDDNLTLQEVEEKIEKIESKLAVKKRVAKENAPKFERRRKPLTKSSMNNDLFVIKTLSLDEQKKQLLKRMDSMNFKNSPFTCTDCYKGFLDVRTYTMHMRRHSDEYGTIVCPVCKAHFRTQRKLSKHKSTIHSFKYVCKKCPYITTNSPQARLHGDWHKGKVYKCPQCSEEFIKYTSYMGHLRIKHPSDFVCELCGYAFVSKKGIMHHKKLKHIFGEVVPEDGPLCELCNIRFLSQDALKTHLNVSRRHNNAFGQNSTDKVIRRERRNDGYHRKYSTQEFTCEQCGMQMTGSRAYYHHFIKMHPGKNRTLYPSIRAPFMCDKCGRIFQSSTLLNDHINIHTKESSYKCKQCDKIFTMKTRLALHSLTHKNLRFPCHICGKSFSNSGNRQRHVFVHSDLRPHKCEICHKSFKTNAEKKSHVNYVHLKKPWPKRAPRKRSSMKKGQNIQSTRGVSETDVQTRPQRKKLGVIGDKPVYYILKN